jgi:hypothetical protein
METGGGGDDVLGGVRYYYHSEESIKNIRMVLPGRPGRGYFPAAQEVNFGSPGRFFPTFSVHDFFGTFFSIQGNIS